MERPHYPKGFSGSWDHTQWPINSTLQSIKLCKQTKKEMKSFLANSPNKQTLVTRHSAGNCVPTPRAGLCFPWFDPVLFLASVELLLLCTEMREMRIRSCIVSRCFHSSKHYGLHLSKSSRTKGSLVSIGFALASIGFADFCIGFHRFCRGH